MYMSDRRIKNLINICKEGIKEWQDSGNAKVLDHFKSEIKRLELILSNRTNNKKKKHKKGKCTYHSSATFTWR